jgi:dolichol-phosphate mannosyltransferase
LSSTQFLEDSNNVFVILPCYNEEESLERLLARFKRLCKISNRSFYFVVVNDGSTDHTLYVAQTFKKEMPIHIINFENNQGVATAFNTGFAYVIEKASDDDIIITIDSDNTMNPYVILDILEGMKKSDVVIASRFVKGGRMVGAGYRTILSYVASWLMRWRIGLPNVTDYSIFYRGYRAKIIRTTFNYYNGKPVAGKSFASMANLLIRMYRANQNLLFTEVPLVLRYDLKEGGSSIKILQTIWGYLMISFTFPNNNDTKFLLL